MSIKSVAVLSPGEMGHTVGHSLAENGLDVLTWIEERSERTQIRAAQAGFRIVPSLQDMVSEADLILSIIVPSQAMELARSVSDALRATGAKVGFVDCNAISPDTSLAIDQIITRSGGQYTDAGIIGLPPGQDVPRFYVSGPTADVMLELDGKGMEVLYLSDSVGDASGVKMCYAALTKGTWALYISILTAAESMGLTDVLMKELSNSQPQAVENMGKVIPSLFSKSGRWVGEMKEIATTFKQVGVTPLFHHGAAHTYKLLDGMLGDQEARLDIKRVLTMEEAILVIAKYVLKRPNLQ